MALDILVVDDEQDICDLISGILSDEGYETRTALTSTEALNAVAERRPSLVVLDIWLQGSELDGLEVLDRIKTSDASLPVIIISGHGNVETAVSAIKRGAYDFIEKPFQSDHLLVMVQRATEAERLARENEELRQRAGIHDELTGGASSINQTRALIQRVAKTNSRVLISGPPGSGKEVAARMLHAFSPRGHQPFIVASAANIEPDRMEAELFGIEQNGEVVRPGLLERAHGGILFLDEVADMPRATQAKILRVLTDQSFERLGGRTKVNVDVRFISATSRDLTDLISVGAFREDLYHRLGVVPIPIPALRNRREDIPELANQFLSTLDVNRRSGGQQLKLSDDVMAALQAYEWPGNVRQLRNVLERMIILAGDDEMLLTAESLPAELSADTSQLMQVNSQVNILTSSLREAREAFEREYLKVQIRRFSGNISKTAAFVGMERSALHRKLKSLGLTMSRRDPAGSEG
ncbi:MAG: sigma-54-dependent transcriptional regulator [Sphingomonadales bacterium]